MNKDRVGQSNGTERGCSEFLCWLLASGTLSTLSSARGTIDKMISRHLYRRVGEPVSLAVNISQAAEASDRFLETGS